MPRLSNQDLELILVRSTAALALLTFVIVAVTFLLVTSFIELFELALNNRGVELFSSDTSNVPTFFRLL